MTQQHPIAVQNFSHVCIGVSDIAASLAFYTAVLGMDVVFDVELEGAGLDSVTGGAARRGRAEPESDVVRPAGPVRLGQ